MNYDIFISYKRRGASLAAAPYLFELLQQRGYNVFLDTKEMRSGHFDDQLLEYISNAKDIIILLEEESLKSWFSEKDSVNRFCGVSDGNDGKAASAGPESEALYRSDWFCKEVMHALSLDGKRIIPLLLNGFQMPEPKDLPPEMSSLPLNQALSVDLSDMEHLIEKFFIGKEYLTSKPKNLALSRHYQAKGGIIGTFLFYTSADSCELEEYGEKIITLTGDNDERHPFKYPVSFAGEHRFHLFNNDTCERMTISEDIEPNCQKYVKVEWTERQNLWELTEEIINQQEDADKLVFWGDSLVDGTIKNEPDFNLSALCFERALDLGSAEAAKAMIEYGRISNFADDRTMFRWYNLAARCGSPEANTSLGDAYYKGRGVERSFEKALEYYQRGAELNDPAAMAGLAIMYDLGRGVDQSYKKAIELYRKAADRGYPKSLFNLALLFEKGEGVEKSLSKAFELYELAAQKNYLPAINNLGVMYEYGQGVEQSYEKAVEYYDLAAGKGYAKSQFNLARMYEGGQGVEQSYEKAAELYSKAVDKGHAGSMYELGKLYGSGRGINQSYEEAAELLQMASERGIALATYGLALMYRTGKGVGKSEEKAEPLIRKAAQEGLPEAKVALANIIREKGEEQDKHKALDLLKEAAEQGCDVAFNQLAWTLHEMNRYEEALPWAERAVQRFPDMPSVIDTIAMVYQGLGRYDEAMTAFLKCLSLLKEKGKERRIEETEAKIEALKVMMNQ